MKRMIAALLAATLLLPGCAWAQGAQQTGQPVEGIPLSQASIAAPVVVTTGLTYQLLLAGSVTRRNFQIQQNNVSNSTDVCYLLYGANITSQVVIAANGTVTLASTGAAVTTSTNFTIANASGTTTITAAQASDVLSQYGSEGRYFPINPSDPIMVTCTTTGDSVSLHWQ